MEIIIRGSPSDIALLWGLIRHQDDPPDGETVPPPDIVVRGFTYDAGDGDDNGGMEVTQ